VGSAIPDVWLLQIPTYSDTAHAQCLYKLLLSFTGHTINLEARNLVSRINREILLKYHFRIKGLSQVHVTYFLNFGTDYLRYI